MSLLDELKAQTKEVSQATSFKAESKASSATGLIQGVGVPVEIERDGGKLRMYVMVSPEAISDPQTLDAVLDNISEMFNLAIWRTKGYQQGGGGFKGGGGYRNNNYNNNRRF